MSDNLRRPHFGKPPVVEVACGIQFAALEEWRTAHFGQFWSIVQKEYSQTEDHPPLVRVQLDPAAVFEPRLSSLPPLRRVFFIKPPGNFLIQAQQNRLLHNWRQIDDADQYPRFDAAYERFIWSWARLNEFLSTTGLPSPNPELWELTYINHIRGAGSQFPRDVWDYLSFYEKSPEATTTTEASAMKIQFVWPLEDRQGTLSLDVQHGSRVGDQEPVLVMELTARGPSTGGQDAMDSWFAGAHNAIVNTFEKLTTTKAHLIWEKL